MTVLTMKTKRGSYLGLNSGVLRTGVGDSYATGATTNYDVDVSDFDAVTVIAALNATALADLGLTVQALDSAGVVVPVPLSPAVTTPAQILSANVAYGIQQYDVRGIQAIRVSVKNNNAATKTLVYLDVLAAVTGSDSN